MAVAYRVNIVGNAMEDGVVGVTVDAAEHVLDLRHSVNTEATAGAVLHWATTGNVNLENTKHACRMYVC